MNLKNAVAGVAFAGGIGLALITGSSGVAVAAPGDGGNCQPPFCSGGPGPGGPGGPGNGPQGPRGPGGPGGPGDFRGPGANRAPDGRDWGPRPPNAFSGFRGAPWGGGPAPWGWGAPPRAGWDRPLPPPGGYWNYGPINYFGYDQFPIWEPRFNGWGFYFFGIWIPL